MATKRFWFLTKQNVPRQQHFVDHEQTLLQKHIAGSPYTGRIPD